MPEYLAPGVYVEETSFRSKSIEGVSTTTTGLIGPSRFGPIKETPDIVTGLGEFERVYGGGEQLEFASGKVHNYLWHAARAFFVEGGKRLYVSRVFKVKNDSDGNARAWRPVKPADDNAKKKTVGLEIRYPGASGNMRVRVSVQLGQNVLGRKQDPNDVAKKVATLGAISELDLVWIHRDGVNAVPGGDPAILAINDFYTYTFLNGEYVFQKSTDPEPKVLRLNEFEPPRDNDKIRVVTLGISLSPERGGEPTYLQNGLPLHPNHQQAGLNDSVFNISGLPLTISQGADIKDGLSALQAFFNATKPAAVPPAPQPDSEFDIVTKDLTAGKLESHIDFMLEGGNDGAPPEAAEYEGTADPSKPYKTGLKQFEDLEDISIVAAPGIMANYSKKTDELRASPDTINNLLIAHAQFMRYRIAVLDSGEGQSVGDIRKMRAKMDSTYAALYYPWVRVLDPITRSIIHLPPSGFVAGIYARNDINRAVFKAPANEVVNLALGFELFLNKGQQDVLNPEGINCFRFFEGRGMLLWGARTISSDPEWKYVNLRRYFAYLERSIDKGTQWAVFEPNGNLLWDNVRRTIEDFLFNEFQMGALLGDKPERAFFVKCDRTTMTQNDLDNGRLVCLIGVAPLRPAEFVIFRIGQWTGDRKV
jgi:uncharacterized protein